MNSKKQMQMLPEMDLGSHHTFKMEISVKKFNRFNNNIIIAHKFCKLNNSYCK